MTAKRDSTKVLWPRGERVTQDVLKAFLRYEPTTGEFVWLVNRKGPGAKQGQVAGRIDGHGYRRIKIAGVEYGAHRLAWLYENGAWPVNEIDHINGVREDNRIANLRDVTAAVNQGNRRSAGKHNSNGFLGVSVGWNNRFRAGIRSGGKNRHLGTFDTPELAHAAYVLAKRQLHEGNTL